MTAPDERLGAPVGGAQSDDYPPRKVDQLTDDNVHRIVELEKALKSSTSVSERLAARVGAFCGSMRFVWLHVIWFGGWIAVNSWPGMQAPDPFPYTFLTLCVNLEAILLSAFILISQNQETRLTERRTHLDLQINLLTEQENTKMLRMLQRISEKVGVTMEADPELAEMEESTRPERLLDQIGKATEQTRDE